jgi:hypothetical protein
MNLCIHIYVDDQKRWRRKPPHMYNNYVLNIGGGGGWGKPAQEGLAVISGWIGERGLGWNYFVLNFATARTRRGGHLNDFLKEE